MLLNQGGMLRRGSCSKAGVVHIIYSRTTKLFQLHIICSNHIIHKAYNLGQARRQQSEVPRVEPMRSRGILKAHSIYKVASVAEARLLGSSGYAKAIIQEGQAIR